MTALRKPPVVVLLIDDQAIIGASIRGVLDAQAHVAFHHLQDANQALSMAVSLGPTVILLDLLMPGVDGLVLLRQLKREDATRDVPVVVLSTKEEPTIKAEAFRLGASDYLIKLPSAVELVARIRYHSEAYRNASMRRLALQALAESQEQLRRSHEEMARQAAGLQIRNRFIKKTFGRYLSDQVVTQLLDSPEGLRLGGESRVVTILMADLRGFTSTCDHLPATDVMRMLNGYLGRMARLIAEHGGTIDEFIGDAILAIFGAPLAGHDDAERAVRCALAMQHTMPDVNGAHAADGLPLLEMGIAVHTGEVVVGNIGSDIRAKYGVVGSNVNLTARIESLTIGGQILISDATREAAGSSVRTGPPVQFRAKGFARDTTVWELLGMQDIAELQGDRDFDSDHADDTLHDTLSVLDPPLPLTFWTIHNNIVAGAAQQGVLVGASGRSGLLKAQVALQPYSDLRILLQPHPEGAAPQELWAKVRRTTAKGTQLHFLQSLSA